MLAPMRYSGQAARRGPASGVEHGTEAGDTAEEQVHQSRTALRHWNLAPHLLRLRSVRGERLCVEKEAGISAK